MAWLKPAPGRGPAAARGAPVPARTARPATSRAARIVPAARPAGPATGFRGRRAQSCHSLRPWPGRSSAQLLRSAAMRADLDRRRAGSCPIHGCTPAAVALESAPIPGARSKAQSLSRVPGSSTSCNASSRPSTSCSSCAALRLMRRRSVPAGTVGLRIAATQYPRSMQALACRQAACRIPEQQGLDRRGGVAERQAQLRSAAAKSLRQCVNAFARTAVAIDDSQRLASRGRHCRRQRRGVDVAARALHAPAR